MLIVISGCGLTAGRRELKAKNGIYWFAMDIGDGQLYTGHQGSVEEMGFADVFVQIG